MPAITFSRDFDWRRSKTQVVAYRAGRTYPVSRAVAKAARAAGAAPPAPASRERRSPDGDQ